MQTGIDQLSVAAHQASQQTRESATDAIDCAANIANDISHKSSEASNALSNTVRRRPLTAIGVAAVLGYVLVRVAL